MLEEADDDTRTATFRVYGTRSLTVTLEDGGPRFDGDGPAGAAPRAGAAGDRPLGRGGEARVKLRPAPSPTSVEFHNPWSCKSTLVRHARPEALVKPAPFDYVAAHSVEEALEALRDDGARVLAGGQSLMPLLNARRERAAAARRHQRRRARRDPAHRRPAAARRDRPPGRARPLEAGRASTGRCSAQAAAPRRSPRHPHARHRRRLGGARRPARPAAAGAARARRRARREGPAAARVRAPAVAARHAHRVRRALAHLRRLPGRGRRGRRRPRARRGRGAGRRPGRRRRARPARGRRRARGRGAGRRAGRGGHRRALVAEVTRRALVECGR